MNRLAWPASTVHWTLEIERTGYSVSLHIKNGIYTSDIHHTYICLAIGAHIKAW